MTDENAAPATRLLARRFANRDELIGALAARLEQTVTRGEHAASVMLSGGSTPLPAYRQLAARRPQARAGLTILYSDDRYVPAESEASNYHQTRELLDALALPAPQVLRVRTELPLEEAAADYAARVGALEARGVRIELGLLGLGADGHTASLFTAQHLRQARGCRAIAVHRPDGRDGISLTPAIFETIGELLFIVAGEDKRAALAALMNRSDASTAWGAVRGCAGVGIWCDASAWPGAWPAGVEPA